MKKEFPSLNGLRAISISLVVFNHFMMNGFITCARFNSLMHIYLDGTLGVNVFFVISGFLITKLLLEEEGANASVSLKNFYIRRVLRIFPAYYVLLLVYFILQLNGFFKLTGASWLSALTFTKQFNCKNDWETGHLWSLSVEEIFYLFWPFLFVVANRYRNKIALSIIAVVVVLRVVLMKWPVYGMSVFTIFQRGDAIMVGCLFALNYERIVRLLINARANLRLALAIMALSFSVALPFLTNQLPVSHISLFVVTLFGNIGIVSSLLIGCIIIISINTQNFWSKLLNSKLLTHIGKTSYSIYLWQEFFVCNQPEFAGLGWIPLSLMLLACANFSYFFIEKPVLKLKNRLT